MFPLRRPHRILSLLALAFLVAFSAACSSGPSTRADESPNGVVGDGGSQTAQELYLSGNRHLEQEQWSDAVDDYEAAAEKDPSRWELYVNKAIAHSADRQFQAAVNAIEQALANGGDEEPSVYYNLGNIYHRRGLYEQAIKAYRASLSVRGETHLDTLVNIASALTISGKHDAARQTYERLEETAPEDPRVPHGYAVLAYVQSNYEEAVSAYDRLLAMEPEYVSAYYGRARAHARLEQYDKAVDDLESFLEFAPDASHADRARGLLELYREKAEEHSQ